MRIHTCDFCGQEIDDESGGGSYHQLPRVRVECCKLRDEAKRMGREYHSFEVVIRTIDEVLGQEPA